MCHLAVIRELMPRLHDLAGLATCFACAIMWGTALTRCSAVWYSSEVWKTPRVQDVNSCDMIHMPGDKGTEDIGLGRSHRMHPDALSI